MRSDLSVRSFIGTRYSDWKDPGFHSHPTLEISILMEGRGVFQWRNKLDALEAGNVVIVPALLEHRFEGIGKSRYGVIHMEHIPNRLMEIVNQFVLDGKPTVFALSPLDKERYERLFREWLKIMSSSLKYSAWTNTAWSEVLLLFLLEHSQTDRAALSIAKAGDWIRENLQHGVQISELADLAGMTKSGFRRLFEQIYKLSPKQYQQQCRMAEAKWQLSSSEKDIMEIADLIGFSRQHSFSLWFKKLEGVPPSEWRRLQRINFG